MHAHTEFAVTRHTRFTQVSANTKKEPHVTWQAAIWLAGHGQTHTRTASTAPHTAPHHCPCRCPCCARRCAAPAHVIQPSCTSRPCTRHQVRPCACIAFPHPPYLLGLTSPDCTEPRVLGLAATCAQAAHCRHRHTPASPECAIAVYFTSVCVLTCPPSTSQRPLRPSAGMCTATRSRTARRWACAASQTSVSRTLSALVHHHKSPHPTPPPSSSSSVAVFDPSAPKRLAMAAHYDTKIIADVVCLTSLLHLTSHHFTMHPHAEPRVHWRHRLCCAVCNAA
jgi:hypothetical protein